jgi:hypothetical protein
MVGHQSSRPDRKVAHTDFERLIPFQENVACQIDLAVSDTYSKLCLFSFRGVIPKLQYTQIHEESKLPPFGLECMIEMVLTGKASVSPLIRC